MILETKLWHLQRRLLRCPVCRAKSEPDLSLVVQVAEFLEQFKPLSIQSQLIHQNIDPCTLKCETKLRSLVWFRQGKAILWMKLYLLSS